MPNPLIEIDTDNKGVQAVRIPEAYLYDNGKGTLNFTREGNKYRSDDGELYSYAHVKEKIEFAMAKADEDFKFSHSREAWKSHTVAQFADVRGDTIVKLDPVELSTAKFLLQEASKTTVNSQQRAYEEAAAAEQAKLRADAMEAAMAAVANPKTYEAEAATTYVAPRVDTTKVKPIIVR